MIFAVNFYRNIIFSLFFLFLMTGCKTETTAVHEPVPEKPFQAPEVKISYSIEPEELIRDNYGYIGIKYLTHEMEKEKISILLSKKNASREDFEKAYKRIPEYGYIVLSIGRQDLMHANTKWYSCTVKKNGNTVFDYRGKEGIPNIKGRDGNWWNIVKLPVNNEIDSELTVYIKDIKTDKSYSFKVMRIETRQQ